MSSTFPLTRLSSVALQEVINQIEPDALVLLSFCSKRIHKLTKLFNKRKALDTNIEVVYNSIARVFFESISFDPHSVDFETMLAFRLFQVFEKSEMAKNRKFETIKIGNYVVPIIKRQKEEAIILDFYFESKTEGIKILLDYITSFLDRPIHKMHLSSHLFPNQIREFIDWTLIKQRSIERINIVCDSTKDEAIHDILDVCNSVNDFTLQVKPTEEFRHEFSFKNNKFCIFDAFWFSLKSLLAIDCRYCQIFDSRLTSREMNQFLHHWKTGGCNKMKEIDIEMESIDLEILLSDLNAIPFPDGVVRTYIDNENEENEVSYGFDIQRNDGVLATIRHEGVDVISACFWMVVWE